MERVSKKAIASVATSKPFKFLIGPLQTEYTIHSALVAHHSPALDAMVNGNFQESREGSVKWDDVDEVVFNSFWQFVYTGDYETPEPLPTTQKDSGQGDQKSDTADKPIEEEPIPETEEEAIEAFLEAEAAAAAAAELPIEDAETDQEKRGSDQKSILWEEFLSCWGTPREAVDTDTSLKDQANRLVHHAKVFTLADRYGVKRLTEISRGKLYDGLTDLYKKGGDYNNMEELVRYISEELVPDQLKNMVVAFSACVVENLWEIKRFHELLEQDTILSKALIGGLLHRLAERPSRLGYNPR
ncbi:btb poz fold [Fusarium pseudoanthophilum]|uniref:Btb poz fold n=1 Tax=Fusarium pseudoanthophilum TaxID=48495 RepID=A0A8H5V470_9HYPO|nr:btb poz fold [Fusarium pseudoanthophilum]